MKTAVFWFRRDLRIEDNIGFLTALAENERVLPVFIFDELITNELETDDPRITFIYQSLKKINHQFSNYGSSLKVFKGTPVAAWKELLQEYDISTLYYNKDYEPYARERDEKIEHLLREATVECRSFKDQVIFEEDEVVKGDMKPYHVFTPYKNKWLSLYQNVETSDEAQLDNLIQQKIPFPEINELQFKYSEIKVRPFDLSKAEHYQEDRDYPFKEGGTYLGPHLRFGTISIRKLVEEVKKKSDVLLSELIWREFFMQILYHYPNVVHENFKSKYNGIVWRNNKAEFEKWCNGMTGYPLVDAGMRELNTTGYMHNRVRMITAGFLCKHLLIDWRWGEAYFASKLLDYELSSNNGNWQWAAGTGCDASPYFRIFNPTSQVKKFDKGLIYVRRWIPEYDTLDYPSPIVEHKMARQRALETYKAGLEFN
ncbi:cryptochrome/photolyase family protein [Lutimonas zeaxanthinifaciens]|uniref:cryptochrome/photolyase family protein n=1 Tax=Lutimonas zeaxanthinifaciens TaxID=3060215 RepID=UPI00265D473C|nr:deoxyribodipyrimidine photo-lyase [Lutimonas sp. YSD2104]WKK66202.1 deoxyribodipyrimidine photo-lyase [Lutimonas sp. YSD2104]